MKKIPTVTDLDEVVFIIEDTIQKLNLKLAELRSKNKQSVGKNEMIINPLTHRGKNHANQLYATNKLQIKL